MVWVERFHLEPRIELLPRMIVRLDREGRLEGADRPRLTGFLAALFQRPDVQASYLTNTSMVERGGRTTLVAALWLSGNADSAQRIAASRRLDVGPWKRRPPDLRRVRVEDREALEAAWGAYLATGDPVFPRKVIDVLDAPVPGGHRREPWLWLAGLARSSLAIEADRHEAVAGLLRQEANTRKGRSRAVLEGLVFARDARAAASALRMTRIVFRNAAAGVRPGSRAAWPVTVYRLGDAFGRVEEEADPAQQHQMLLVAALPDVWEMNVDVGMGRHQVDAGPVHAFRLPVAPARRGERTPEIEIGREFEYLRAHAATREARMVAGERYDVWTVRGDGHVVTVLADPGTERPRRVKVAREGRTLAELELLEYARDLSPALELFRPPDGIRFER